jgi:hypothetical protein
VRKILILLGTFFIASILISGQVIAVEDYYIEQVDDYEDCINTNEARYEEDYRYASLGDGDPPVLGWIKLDFGSGTSMGPSQDFTVYGFLTGTTEEYNVTVISQSIFGPVSEYVGSGEDTSNEIFTTPSTPNISWRYVLIEATSGSTSGGDSYYGPEIDAVGYTL